MWSALVWLNNTKAIFQWPLSNYLPLNYATLITILYSTYYILLEPVAGMIFAPFLVIMNMSALSFLSSHPKANSIATIIHVLSWVFQLIGHGVYEKRAPALKDNLAQALILAPFFVFIEGLFSLGYRPQLRARLHLKIDEAVKKWKTTSKDKK